MEGYNARESSRRIFARFCVERIRYRPEREVVRPESRKHHPTHSPLFKGFAFFVFWGCSMRRELEPVLTLARELSAADLPAFIGELEEVRVTALARITTPTIEARPDELLT